MVAESPLLPMSQTELKVPLVIVEVFVNTVESPKHTGWTVKFIMGDGLEVIKTESIFLHELESLIVTVYNPIGKLVIFWDVNTGVIFQEKVYGEVPP